MSTEHQARPTSSRRWLIAALVVSMSITAGSLLFALTVLNNRATTNTGAAIVDSVNYYDGATTYDPPKPINDFTLTGNDGQSLSLSDLRGKPLLVYFGYTHCPDICPTTLANFERIKTQLGDQADQVNFLMVSIDGARDTPQQMKSFMSAFDSSFIGMTGSEAEVRPVAEDFNLYFHANTEEGADYSVDHTAAVFLLDQDSNLRTLFSYGTDPGVIVTRLQDLL